MITFNSNDDFEVKMSEIISNYRDCEESELEIVLGQHEATFIPGVSFGYFTDLYKGIEAAIADEKYTSNWTVLHRQVHIANYYFPDGVRGRYKVGEPTEFVRKSPWQNVDLHIEDRKYDCRISLRKENKIDYIATQSPVKIRLQERWSYIYKNSWRYDLTKVVTGQTKEDACHNQPVFEVEVELLKKNSFFKKETNFFIAQHILQKTVDLLGRFTTQKGTLPLHISKFNIQKYSLPT